MRCRTTAWSVESWQSTMVPPEAAAFAREVVAAAGPATRARAKALLFAASRAGAFALSVGLELSPAVVLHPSVVERFIVTNSQLLSGPTRRTLRTNLRALARATEAHPAPMPVPLPREHSKIPYDPAEISAYLALADAQPTPARRARASALICLGAGAGLGGADLREVHGTDVRERSGGVVVTVSGHRARTVPVLASYHATLLACARLAGEDLVAGRPGRNVTSGLVASLAGGQDLPRLELGRLRATWLADAARAIGLRAFMDAAGVNCSQRLGDIASAIPELGEAESVRLLGGRPG